MTAVRILRDRTAPVLRVCARGLAHGADELTIAAGAAFFLAGIGMLSVAAAFITGGALVAAFGIGRIAYSLRSSP